MGSDGRIKVKSTVRHPSLPRNSGLEAKAPEDRPAPRPPPSVLHQARVRSVGFDVQHQAPCITFEVPRLHRGAQFCRVRTQPPTDVRRTRFSPRQVELVVYGALFWQVGDTTTLELEPYAYAVGPRPRRGQRAYDRPRR